MVMNMYSDIDDKWSFTETGDLKINYNYRQSIKHRLLCPLHYLNMYYENYGSNLYQQLGERYNEEIVFEEVSNTLRQDINIYNYEINNIDFIDGELILNLTINGDNVWFSYHIYDEMNEFITVDSEIFYDENWKLKVILNINSSEYIFIKNLNKIYGEIETVSYMNCYRENEIINIELIINGFKKILKIDLDGNILWNEMEKIITKVKIIWYDNDDEKEIRPTNVDALCSDGKRISLNKNDNFEYEYEAPRYGEDGEIEYDWSISDIAGYTLYNVIKSDNITIFTYSLVRPSTPPQPPSPIIP